MIPESNLLVVGTNRPDVDRATVTENVVRRVSAEVFVGRTIQTVQYRTA